MDEPAIKVLLIDDDPDILDISKQFLELDCTISVDTSLSATDALNLIGRREYDVLVSDYQMPGKDGIQLLKEIRETGNSIPFIIFTGKGREEVAIEALNAGADFYLQKGGQSASQFAELANMIRQAYSKKTGERALSISEARLRVYIDNAPEGIFIVDAKGNYQDVNRTACSMLKYSREELLKLNFKDITEKSVAHAALDGFQRLRKKGKLSMETILVRKDSVKMPIFLNAVELPNQMYMAFCTDILERKRAVEALMESEERYRLLVESAAESIVVIQDGLISMVNPMAIKMIGHPERELISKSFCSFVHPNDRAMAVENYQRRINGEVVPSRYELRLLAKNGVTKWFEISAVVIEWEGGPATLNFLMDITERKMMEGALKESEIRFRELVQMLPVAVYEANLQSILTFVNQRALEMFGYTQQDFSHGFYSLEMLISDDRERGQRNIQDVLNSENQGPKEYVARRKDGSVFLVSIISAAILQNGMPVGMRGVVTDITEQKRADSALRLEKEFADKLINAQQDTLFLFDPATGKPIKWSKSFNEISGYNDKEIATMKAPDDFYDEGDIKKAEEAIKNQFAYGRASVELSLITKERVRIPFEYVLTTIESVDGKPLFLSIGRNVINRKIAEKSLSESESRFRELFNNMLSGVAFYKATLDGSDFIFTDLNKFAERMENVRKDDVIGKTVTETFPGAIDMGILDVFRRVWKTGKSERLPDAMFIDAHGKATWRDNVVYKLPNEEIVAIYNDITERKLTENALQSTKERYESLFNQMIDCIYISDLEGNNMSANAALLALLGYTKEELSSLNFFSMLNPEQVPKMLENVEEIMRTGSQKQLFEIRLRRKNGEYVNLETSASVVYQKGVPYAIQGVARDVTERTRLESNLRKSEELRRSLVEKASEAVGVIQDEFFKLVNPKMSEMTGFSESEILSMTFAKFLHPDDLDQVSERYRNRMRGEDPPGLWVMRLLTKSGNYIWVEIGATRIEWEGRPAVLTFGRDISDRKRSERAIEEMNRKLNLLSSITRHDIKNQLMALDGNLTLLSMKELSPGSEELLRKSNSALNRITAMITFTKEYEDVGVKDPIWQNIRGVIEKEAKDVALGPVKLVNDVPANLEVYADPLIIKVFNNLIDNAIRHGDKITTIHFFAEESEGSHRIICEDDGIGIPADTKRKLFMHSSGKSHGFGLFLSREMLTITGITIVENGEPEKGARFEIIVPADAWRSRST